MFLHLEQLVIAYAEHVHLAFFAPLASFLEEIIPPIPSPSVMIATGSIAEVQNYTIYGLILLAVLGAIGKTFGASVVYFIIDKAEDFLFEKKGNIFGVTHSQIEAFGSRLSRGTRDYVILVVLRSLPIIPSTVVSIGCGLLKVQYKIFVITTFVGSFIRDLLFIILGYFGTKAVLNLFVENTNKIESLIQILVIVVVVAALGYLYFNRKKKSDSKVVEILKNGGVGIIPTDTIYGIVASALLPSAVEKIAKIKGRSSSKGYIVLISSIADLNLFGINLSTEAIEFLNRFWPGKVSVEFFSDVPKYKYLRNTESTNAFRFPDNQKLLSILKQTGPLVAPSANLEGQPPAKNIEEAKKYFGDKVDFYEDGGELNSLPSTLVRLKGDKIEVLREGAVKIK
jgi:L-threonylcarbamoyladenylate synthase